MSTAVTRNVVKRTPAPGRRGRRRESVQHQRLLREHGEALDEGVHLSLEGPVSTSACTPCLKLSASAPWMKISLRANLSTIS